ncbi:putative toxin-antitoxin system toxin component, PIN family [Rhodoferax sp.]|uniref:putative toxin-antitoxin system toxin component, PIN family n=1 Tax=Rhodoferax sp. TaxID=50421 RepID=UPI002849F720|nr:putative toxin-antitoxin system toxin component, PIN family [Rhodoferax sp.]MDR3368835.1 putative toxin-antitoxin system toxin component, PIN family [Rhodoferax sp.]
MRADAQSTRIVVDTNVWLSAALSPTGAPSQVLRRVLAQGVPVFSDATFAELEARIWKPKFDRYLTMETRQGILHDARALGHWVDIPEAIATQRFSRDKDDDKFIHTAIAGEAMWLVTGDLDLLVIQADLRVRIVAPAQALLMEDFLSDEN